MEEVLRQILTRLDKLDRIEDKVDKIELDISAIKSDVKKFDAKMDSLTDAVAHTMESVTELKDKIEKQDVEIRVIKGGKTQNA